MYLTGADDGRRCGDSDDDGEKVTIISDVRWWLLEGFITLVVGSVSNWLLHVSHSDARLFRWNVWGKGLCFPTMALTQQQPHHRHKYKQHRPQ